MWGIVRGYGGVQGVRLCVDLSGDITWLSYLGW